MANTVNKGYKIPANNDSSDVITDLASNFTKIDADIKANEDAIANHGHTADQISYTDGSVQDALDQLQGISFIQTEKINMYDASKAVDGYVGADGNVVVNSGAKLSDFMEVIPGETYTSNFNWNSGFYDANFAFVSPFTAFSYPSTTFTIPNNVKYVRASFANPDTTPIAAFVKGTSLPTYFAYSDPLNSRLNFKTSAMATDILVQMANLSKSVLMASKWKNKKVNVLGDSIPNGYTATVSYLTHLQNDLGLSLIRNYGVNSTTIAKKDVGNTTNGMFLRYSSMDNDADLVILHGGINDVGNAIPLGTMAGTTDTLTFFGACHVLLKGLIDKYPTKKLAVFTPLQAQTQNIDTTRTYVNALVQVANYYAIPVLDLFNGANINPYNTNHKTNFMPDGLHPNDAGHRRIADRMVAFLNTL